MRSGKMRRERSLYGIAAALCATGVLVCGGLFLYQWKEYNVSEKAYRILQQTAVGSSLGSLDEERENQSDEIQAAYVPQVDFEALKQINPDVVGWLYGPDTAISYPVVQGEDNSYYLKHLFDGTPNSAGCLFLDSRCEALNGKHSVIYGHYMKNGTLFASLEEYQSQEYYEAHPYFFLITPEKTFFIQLFSAYLTEAAGDAWQLSFPSEQACADWLESLRERSSFISDVVPNAGDKVITLSTCSYAFQNARFVCHGLVRESEET